MGVGERLVLEDRRRVTVNVQTGCQKGGRREHTRRKRRRKEDIAGVVVGGAWQK
jgi:hypothetical protein